jgi:predicted O-linked N-acetylglucosamine transferase (SPINDLY family)
MKARLASGRATSALFDAGRFARQLEMAYATMHARAGRGEAPQAFAVPPAA